MESQSSSVTSADQPTTISGGNQGLHCQNRTQPAQQETVPDTMDEDPVTIPLSSLELAQRSDASAMLLKPQFDKGTPFCPVPLVAVSDELEDHIQDTLNVSRSSMSVVNINLGLLHQIQGRGPEESLEQRLSFVRMNLNIVKATIQNKTDIDQDELPIDINTLLESDPVGACNDAYWTILKYQYVSEEPAEEGPSRRSIQKSCARQAAIETLKWVVKMNEIVVHKIQKAKESRSATMSTEATTISDKQQTVVTTTKVIVTQSDGAVNEGRVSREVDETKVGHEDRNEEKTKDEEATKDGDEFEGGEETQHEEVGVGDEGVVRGYETEEVGDDWERGHRNHGQEGTTIKAEPRESVIATEQTDLKQIPSRELESEREYRLIRLAGHRRHALEVEAKIRELKLEQEQIETERISDRNTVTSITAELERRRSGKAKSSGPPSTPGRKKTIHYIHN